MFHYGQSLNHKGKVTTKSGKLEGENTYTLKDPSGNIVIEDGSGDGGEDNGPESGEQFNKCE
ncbi:MAG: hypothetical protein ACPGRP_05470 [Flavobacteriaceae bacterium]